jgi:hypothetical protein
MPMSSDEARLISSHDAMSESFDRTLTALSGGSLALSISFVKDIAPHPTSVWAIQGSWIAMSFSLALILISYAVSVQVHRRIIDAHRAEKSYGDHPAWVRVGVAVLNHASGIAFLVGAALLVFFAFVNV